MKITKTILPFIFFFVIKLNGQSPNQNYILSAQYLENILVDDNFTSSMGNWQENGNVTTSLSNGKIRVNVNSSFEGLKNPLNGFKTIQGETLRVKIDFNSGNTTSNVRLYLEERNSAGGLVGYRMINNNLQTGINQQYSYLMTTTGNSMIFRVDKDNTNTSITTFFEVDYVSLRIDNNTTIDKVENITYLDGFGRPKQSVGVRQTPNQKDFVQHIEYDQFGRTSKQYLALPSTQDSGSFLSNSKALTENYYQSTFADQHPFSEVRYDNSPLNRIQESTGPGNTWQIMHNSDSDHTEKRDYNVNTSAEVQRFIINGEDQPLNVSHYNSRNLFKDIVKNENWAPTDAKLNTTEIFKDKNGRTVAEFNFEEVSGVLKTLKTYYVFDISGNLRYVLPPKLIDNIVPPPPPINYANVNFSWPTSDFVTPSGMQGNVRLSINNNTLSLSFANLIISGRSSDINTSGSRIPNGIIENPNGPILDPGGDPIIDPLPDPRPDPPALAQTYVLNSQTIKLLSTTPSLPDMFLGDIMVFNSNIGSVSFRFKVGEASISNGNLIITRTSSSAFTNFSTSIFRRLSQLSLPSLPVNLLDDLAFQYKYDQFNRQIAQKVPGKGWEYMVYDQLDRPVLTQDANLKLQNKWLFNKYDVYGRLVYSGLHTNSASRDQLQNQLDTFINNSSNKDNAETKSNNSMTVGSVVINYTNSAFPNNSLEVLKVNYFDDYNFTDPHLPNIPTSILNQQVTTRHKGLQTATWTKTLGGNSWSKDYNIYDEKGRVISVYNRNHLGGFTENKSELDFRGKVLNSITTHKRIASSADLITVEDTYEYDHSERPILHLQSINGQPLELIAKNSFNELGQIVSKSIGGNLTTQLQTIDYSYNIRGWLESMNNPNSLGFDLFGYSLNYTNPTQGSSNVSTPYNGYIKQTVWRSAHNGIKKSYAFEYDELDRFIQSSYRENNSLTGGVGRFETYSLQYDSNGNIKTLSRNNNIGSQIDKLGYTYDNGNRLLGINDITNNSFGFNDSSSGNDYFYDANGNLIRDNNKNITSITYNHLDLVERVNFTNGARIEFDYDAVGNKLRMRNILPNGSSTVIDYLNGFQYSGNQLQFFPTPEGYVAKDGVAYKYVYVLTDHLGNNRVSFMDDGNLVINSNEILSSTDYYVMGLPHQGEHISGVASNYNYKYQGKEKLDFDDYNMYDFGSRMYDPTVGRWFNTDPQNQFHSPYLAMGNNGIMMIDPNGELAFLAPIIKVAIKIAVKAAAKSAVKVAAKSVTKGVIKKAIVKGAKGVGKFAKKYAKKAFSKEGLKVGLKSGGLNTLASYDPKNNFGDFLGSFGAGFVGGTVGLTANSKFVGAMTGGVGNWALNGAKFDYKGAQYFVGGALSSYQGIGKKVKGGKLFKLAETNPSKLNKFLYKHGNTFVQYGLQNTAYDFAYSKQKDFAKRGWNHLSIFGWGGLSGNIRGFNGFSDTLNFEVIDWGINGAIKKNFKGIKTGGSQTNKAFINSFKWILNLGTNN